jgi:hypothetical protein
VASVYHSREILTIGRDLEIRPGVPRGMSWQKHQTGFSPFGNSENEVLTDLAGDVEHLAFEAFHVLEGDVEEVAGAATRPMPGRVASARRAR